jgi:HlyD family secretion protein
MQRNILRGALLAGALLLAGVGWATWRKPEAPPVAAAAPTPARPKLVVAAGRVEPASEEIRIASELDGRLRRVLVMEGDAVRAGQIIAELENGDYAARVALAQAETKQREAALARLRNGSRQEDRRASDATVREAEIVVDNARIEFERRRSLLERGAIARTELDSTEREYRVAQARLEAAKERRAVLEQETRPEDLLRAEADLAAARARLQEMQALLAKTIIRSPLNAVVLKRMRKSGESVSSDGVVPIVTLGDTQRLHVRMDVDEADVDRVRPGLRAWVTASAYGEQRFTGTVLRLEPMLGRKNIRTEEPSERVDTKILESIIELDANAKLPVGLRVDAFIEPQGGRQ